MKIVSTMALAAALAAGPALAQVTPAPANDANGVYQVFRTTDSQLSCEQIISELNLLNQQIKAQQDAQAAQLAQAQQKAQQAAQPRRGGGFGGLLGAVAGSAAPFGLARNPLAAQAAMAAANAAAQGAANAQAQQQADQVAAANAAIVAAGQQPASQSNEMQRLNRVKQLMTQKGC